MDGGSCAVAVWSAGGSGAPLARSSRLFGAKGSSSGILLRLLSRFLWVHHYRPVHRRVQDGLTQVQPLLLVHAWSNSEYGLLLLLRLVRVHHKRAGLREGWRFADPRLVALVGLRHHWFELAGGASREVEALPDSRVLKHYQRPLGRQLDFSRARLARSRLPVCPEAGSGDIGFIALGTDERPFIVVQPPVQFQVDVLGERLRTFVTAVGLVVGVQSLVSLQVAGRGEPLATIATAVGFLPSMHKLVLLEVRQLSEVFQTSRLGASKGSLTRVGSYMHFQVTQLAKDLFTGITPVYNLSVLLFQRKWKGSVTTVSRIRLVWIFPRKRWFWDRSGSSLLEQTGKLGGSQPRGAGSRKAVVSVERAHRLQESRRWL